MTLTYLGKTYECVSAEKKPNEIVIHTGNVVDGEEIVYHIYGDIDFDAVVLEGGSWTEDPAPSPSGNDSSVWDEMDAAYQNGVDSL